ncbi:plasmalemma vesicle-associated protein [Tenrec ecaudatus]|uniref:plasmalemma vesicle-associated protein n=1 Tax=Tenrec ecaudatus TaxID=94439 RepID=UPI003F5A52CB
MGLAMDRGAPYSRALHKAGGAQRGCWYYMRYFFLFVSLIQFLIILGLVLFMVYGNVHGGTESNLQATERRADGLYGQVVGLSATRANLTKELNLTARAKEAIMQMLLGTRRDLDRINASFRQCQAERATHLGQQRYMAAIILSEKQCHDHLKSTNKSCEALRLTLDQKAKMLEVELTKEKAVCTKDKETLQLNKRLADEQLAECGKAQAQLQQERRIAEERLQKVEALCHFFDKEKFETSLRNLWRDSIISRALDSLGYHPYPLSSEVASIRRTCEHMPTLMTTKVAELAHSLRADIDRVARENADLQRQKLELERSLQASQEAKEKVTTEAKAQEAKLQIECTRQTQLTLAEKATLQKEREGLTKQLEERKKEIEYLKMQMAVSASALDTCIKAKSQPMSVSLSRPVGPLPSPQVIDPAALEEFKKKILDSQRPPAGNVLIPSRPVQHQDDPQASNNGQVEAVEEGVLARHGTWVSQRHIPRAGAEPVSPSPRPPPPYGEREPPPNPGTSSGRRLEWDRAAAATVGPALSRTFSETGVIVNNSLVRAHEDRPFLPRAPQQHVGSAGGRGAHSLCGPPRASRRPRGTSEARDLASPPLGLEIPLELDPRETPFPCFVQGRRLTHPPHPTAPALRRRATRHLFCERRAPSAGQSAPRRCTCTALSSQPKPLPSLLFHLAPKPAATKLWRDPPSPRTGLTPGPLHVL